MKKTFSTLIEAYQAYSLLNDPQVRFLDCQFDLLVPNAGEQAYKTAHIPHALFVDLNTALSSAPTAETGRHPLPASESITTDIGSWGIDNDTQVIAYDGGGSVAASRLWWVLRWLGHTNVAVLNGGLKHWQAEGLPTDLAVEPVAKKVFKPKLQQNLLVDTAEILAAQQHGMVLVDARSPERYRGEQEPIDPVAGHIPGALNYFQMNNLQESGLFKGKETLRQQITEAIGARAPENIIHYCGSGVSACHNILAMEYVGMHGSKLYPGSWSEWITDSSRPVVTGTNN